MAYIYVIGSLTQADEIKTIAARINQSTGIDVTFVKPEPDKTLYSLIRQCFSTIQKASLIVAVPKETSLFGTGTLYEICYAQSIGIPVLKWIEKDK